MRKVSSRSTRKHSSSSSSSSGSSGSSSSEAEGRLKDCEINEESYFRYRKKFFQPFQRLKPPNDQVARHVNSLVIFNPFSKSLEFFLPSFASLLRLPKTFDFFLDQLPLFTNALLVGTSSKTGESGTSREPGCSKSVKANPRKATTQKVES